MWHTPATFWESEDVLQLLEERWAGARAGDLEHLLRESGIAVELHDQILRATRDDLMQQGIIAVDLTPALRFDSVVRRRMDRRDIERLFFEKRPTLGMGGRSSTRACYSARETRRGSALPTCTQRGPPGGRRRRKGAFVVVLGGRGRPSASQALTHARCDLGHVRLAGEIEVCAGHDDRLDVRGNARPFQMWITPRRQCLDRDD